MKKTINVNIGGVPFIIDEDAHTMLSAYLGRIERRLGPLERVEVMEDVENRIAGIFSERLGVRVQVVDCSMVGEAIAIIGSADAFGDEQPERQSAGSFQSQKTTATDGRFYRSSTDRIFGGICGSLAPIIKIDVSLLRVIVAALAFFTMSMLFWAYIIAWVIIPQEPITDNK